MNELPFAHDDARFASADDLRFEHDDDVPFERADHVPFEHVEFVSRALDAIHRVLVRAKAIDLRGAEPDNSEASHDVLLRTIAPLIDEASAIIGRVTEQFEADENDRERVDVADIAALAGMSLQQRRALLVHAQPCDHWSFLENCERSLRSLVKSASVVEGALARYDHLPARLHRGVELATSLAVRRRYAALRRDVLRAGATQSDLAQRLQSVSRSLATLLNCLEYSAMRLGDRRELRMLQFRVQSWLSAERPDESGGERTWEEAVAVVMLLGGISRRSELVAHDASVLAELSSAIARGSEPRAMRDAAEALFGLDAELDRLLDIRSPEGLVAARWRAVVTRLAIERGLPAPGDPSEPDLHPFE